MAPGSAASASGAGKAAARRQNAAPSPLRLAPRRAIGPRPPSACLDGRDREEAGEARIELMVVAGQFLADSDVDQRVTLVEDAEIRVRLEAVIHEAPVVAVEDHHA